MTGAGRRERKVVSVLFADLVGFTARTETLDPEEVEAILRPFHDRLRSELEQRGGTVEKFIGDAVMAVFGAPVAHEDDAERAVRAALAIRDWIREEEELEVRIAVNTGEVIVSFEPGAARGLVAGDVVNTASRLQTAAPVNGILVGETTYNATSRAIEYRDAPPVDAKGKAEPVPVWEVVQARSRYGADVTHKPGTPLVGRERELGLLVSTLARAQHERSPQLVTLVGVPGIGKSRLVYELFAEIDRRPELVYWRQGRCLPYGDGVAFWALGEIVKAHAGILEGESEEEAARRLRTVVEEAVQEPDDAAWVLRELKPLVGLADDEEGSGDRRAESFAAWRRFFEGLAELDPLVLVVEDLHWADEGLLDFIDHLIDWATDVPILVVGTARPELLTRRADWGGGKPNAATISLSPLTEAETATLVHGLLERAVLPAAVQTALLERAGGNPLYAEEFARIALERGMLGGAGDLPLPESVQGLIAARLDALSGDEKALVQDASVLGKVFWLGAVEQLGELDRDRSEGLLHELARKQFVQRERRSSMEGDTQYAFAHTLVRDVAYGQIPRADRTEKHRRAAAWLESVGRPEDYAELRAHHYLSALEALPTGADDGDLRRSARLALREAGERAASLKAFESAARHTERALELWPEDDPDRPRLLLALADQRSNADIWDERDGAVARDALLAAGDPAGAAVAEIILAEVLWNLGRGEEVAESLERAAELASDLPVSEPKARVYTGLFRLYFLAQRDREAAAVGEEALAMAEQLGLKELRAQVLSARGSLLRMQGDPAGIPLMEESIQLFEEVNSANVQRPLNNLADAYFNLGRLEESAATARRMREGWKRYGGVDWHRWLEAQEIRLDYLAGRWDAAVATADRWIADSEEGTGHYLEPVFRWYRGRMRFARGDREGALADTSTALDVSRVALDPQLVIPSLAFHSRLLWELGETSAEQLALEVVERSKGLKLNLAYDWFPEAAILLNAYGRRAELDRLAEETPVPTRWRDAGLALGRDDPLGAAVIFRDIGARPHEADSYVLAARDGLETELAEAIDFFREVGASAFLAEAQSLAAETRSA
ncbi:MAG TPA: AAA family ATPase [Gaiellaceae bacterium]|nr:AAA family ATPase [Gaiellaceae bacterium]